MLFVSLDQAYYRFYYAVAACLSGLAQEDEGIIDIACEDLINICRTGLQTNQINEHHSCFELMKKSDTWAEIHKSEVRLALSCNKTYV